MSVSDEPYGWCEGCGAEMREENPTGWVRIFEGQDLCPTCVAPPQEGIAEIMAQAETRRNVQ